jgi:hypothetical protein
MASSRAFVDEFAQDERLQRPTFGHELIAGAKAGQVAGLAMAVALMAISGVFLGQGLFYPLQLIAAAVLGDGAMGPVDARAIVVGILIHQFGPSLVWGFVFGAVVWAAKPRGSVALLMWGLFVGAVAQVFDVYVLLPLLSGELSGRLPFLGPLQRENLWVHIPAAASWLAHLVFGLGLSLYPWKYDPAAHRFD